MSNTVVGVYEFYLQAQGALDELLASGFAPADIRLKPHDETPTARKMALQPESEARAASHGIGHFFRLLFGLEEQSGHADLYAEAVRRGSYVLTLHAAGEQRTEQAAAIMNQHDPVDIDDCASRWRGEGWLRFDQQAPIFSDSEVARERSASLAGGQQDRDWPDPAAGGGIRLGRVRLFKQAVQRPQREAAEPAASAQESPANASQAWPDATSGDADFRSHWQSTYGHSGGSYEDYAPAYRFGATQASAERYRGHRWSDSETLLRHDWEAAYPASSWDSVRDAVRHGWEQRGDH